MGWLTRIKDSLLTKIRKKIPEKQLESVDKTREEKKIKKKVNLEKKIKTDKIDPLVNQNKNIEHELVKETPKKKSFFGLFKKKTDVITPEKSPEKKKKLVSKIKNRLI